MIPVGNIRTAYANSPVGAAVLAELDSFSRSLNLGGVVTEQNAASVALAPGDVVMIPDTNIATGDGQMHHVAVVVEVAAAATDYADSLVRRLRLRKTRR